MQNAENQQNGSPAADRCRTTPRRRPLAGSSRHPERDAASELVAAARQSGPASQSARATRGRRAESVAARCCARAARIRASARRDSRISRRPNVWPAKRARWRTSSRNWSRESPTPPAAWPARRIRSGNKLREALGEAQQNELEMHMRQNAQFIRQGYGSRPGCAKTTSISV